MEIRKSVEFSKLEDSVKETALQLVRERLCAHLKDGLERDLKEKLISFGFTDVRTSTPDAGFRFSGRISPKNATRLVGNDFKAYPYNSDNSVIVIDCGMRYGVLGQLPPKLVNALVGDVITDVSPFARKVLDFLETWVYDFCRKASLLLSKFSDPSLISMDDAREYAELINPKFQEVISLELPKELL